VGGEMSISSGTFNFFAVKEFQFIKSKNKQEEILVSS
jgi:hypothetical protein